MAKATSAKDLLSGGYTKASGRAMGAERPETPGGPALEVRTNTTAATPAKVVYERITTFLTPALRQWLRTTERGLEAPNLSRSDVIRLAVSRLRDEVETGLDLEALLIKQAHDEAEELPGRRRRGLPSA